MNEVLIISDSHGLKEELVEIKNRHQAKVYIHCGDSELPVNSPYLKGYTTVRGNCDWNARFPEEKVLLIGDLRFFITHGHLHRVKENLQNIQNRARKLSADIICFGHSHIAVAEKVDDQLFINPGSVYLPRRPQIPTYVILQWETRHEIMIQFYDANGEKLDNMRQKINL